MHTLREATPADRDQVCEVWDVSGITNRWNNPPVDFDLAMATPTSTIFVAEANGVIDGVIMPGFDGHRGWLHMVGVRPEVQGSGIGRMLVNAAVKYLHDLGTPAIHLMVMPTNTQAVKFWERYGFERIDPPVWNLNPETYAATAQSKTQSV